MKHCLCGWLLGLVLVCTARAGLAQDDAAEESPFGGGAELDFRSRYMWHALPFTPGPVLQPNLWVDGWMCSLWSFADLRLPAPNQDTEIDEVDVGLDCGFEVGNLEVTPGVAGYVYPGQDDSPATGELTLALVYAIDWFRLITDHSVDIASYPGAYSGDAGVGMAFEWDHFTLEGSLLAVFAEDTFNETYVGENKAAVTGTVLEVVSYVDLPAGLYVKPHASLSVLVPDFVADAFGERAVLEFGFALGGEL